MNDDGSEGLAIRARGLRKCYEGGRVRALDGLDIDVADGSFVAICGPSGCGKSTFLNVVAAIDRPDAGRLQVCGEEVAHLRGRAADRFRARTVGLVFQLHNLLPNLTALENVQAAMLAAGVAARSRVARARAVLERVGLARRLHALPPQLSGGERQRVAIARALTNRPRLVLADEPTGALDSRTGRELIDLLCEIRADLGTTVVVVTHEREVAARADTVLTMRDGRIEASAGEAVSRSGGATPAAGSPGARPRCQATGETLE